MNTQEVNWVTRAIQKKEKNKNFFPTVVPFIVCHVTQDNHLQHWYPFIKASYSWAAKPVTCWKSKKYIRGELYKTMGNHGKPEWKGEGQGWRGEFLRQKSNLLVWKQCDQLWSALSSHFPWSSRGSCERMNPAAWPCLALSGPAWLSQALPGSLWLCQALPGSLWPCQALPGSFWPCQALPSRVLCQNCSPITHSCQ